MSKFQAVFSTPKPVVPKAAAKIIAPVVRTGVDKETIEDKKKGGLTRLKKKQTAGQDDLGGGNISRPGEFSSGSKLLGGG